MSFSSTQHLVQPGREDPIKRETPSTQSVEELTPPRTESPTSVSSAGGRLGSDLGLNGSANTMSQLAELFEENITAKVFRTARDHLPIDETTAVSTYLPPTGFPEFVPQTGDDAGSWALREPEFWTAGFFPGTLYLMLERLIKFQHTQGRQWQSNIDVSQLRLEFQRLCELWTEPLHAMSMRRDTHDVGFIVMPALQKDWELTGNPRSFNSIVTAARSLASRYVPGAKAIRSWDARVQKNLQITCQCQNVLLIIDSMCNLDLLYYAAGLIGEEGQELVNIATAHAEKLMETHLRLEKTTPVNRQTTFFDGQWYSTYHVANVDPRTGEVKEQFTAQGHTKESTWARGQAWGILGYAQTYTSTKDIKFLEVACGLSEYFLFRLESCPRWPQDVGEAVARAHEGGRYVPLWDFDARQDDSVPIRDSSAGSIAANGMLILSQALVSLGKDELASRFRKAAVSLIAEVLHFALAPEKASFQIGHKGFEIHDAVSGRRFEALVKHGTANNNEHAMRRYSDHGIVYGDYYLVQFGNRLLDMGLI